VSVEAGELSGQVIVCGLERDRRHDRGAAAPIRAAGRGAGAVRHPTSRSRWCPSGPSRSAGT